jgi:hypothetical protein
MLQYITAQLGPALTLAGILASAFARFDRDESWERSLQR